MKRIIKREFNDIGEKIIVEIQLKYEDMKVSEFPESCYKCPVGFMSNDCGRTFPLTADGRPSTCKLKQVDIFCENKDKR